MTEPGRIRSHAQAAGCATAEDYALELEDILEGIVAADRDWLSENKYDLHAALLRGRELVDSWDIRP